MLSFAKFTDEMRHALDRFVEPFDREHPSAQPSVANLAREILKDLAGSQGGGERIFSGVFVEVKNLRCAFQQVRGEFARLVVDPAGRVRQSNFLARGDDFKGTDAVQNEFYLAKRAFCQE